MAGPEDYGDMLDLTQAGRGDQQEASQGAHRQPHRCEKELIICQILGRRKILTSSEHRLAQVLVCYWVNMGPILWSRFASSTQHKQTSVKASTHLVGSPNYKELGRILCQVIRDISELHSLSKRKKIIIIRFSNGANVDNA